MVDNQIESFPKRPLTPSELLRLGAAMQPFGLAYGPEYENQQIWIVMEKEIPHRLLDLVASKEAADAIREGSGRAEEVDVYGPFAPPPPMIRGVAARQMDYTDPSEHNNTMLLRAQGTVAAPSSSQYNTYRAHADIQSMTLTVNFSTKANLPTVVVFPIDPQSDAIFLTRGAREAFAYPRYLSIFGPDYLEKLRADLQEP